jgi:hypothetical protein
MESNRPKPANAKRTKQGTFPGGHTKIQCTENDMYFHTVWLVASHRIFELVFSRYQRYTKYLVNTNYITMFSNSR